mgnify:CR=1 FL=1
MQLKLCRQGVFHVALGVINLLGLAKKHGARILQTSTSEVYGDPLEHPQKETYRGNVSTTGPRAVLMRYALRFLRIRAF